MSSQPVPARRVDLDARPHRTTARAAASPGRLPLTLGLLAVPGSTVAWSLPAGGLWIGAPLALAAIATSVQSRKDGHLSRPAVAGLALGVLCLAFMAACAAFSANLPPTAHRISVTTLLRQDWTDVGLSASEHKPMMALPEGSGARAPGFNR